MEETYLICQLTGPKGHLLHIVHAVLLVCGGTAQRSDQRFLWLDRSHTSVGHVELYWS